MELLETEKTGGRSGRNMVQCGGSSGQSLVRTIFNIEYQEFMKTTRCRYVD